MLIALFCALTLARQLHSQATAQAVGTREWRELACADGVILRYAVVSPEPFDAKQPHPVLLAVPSGDESRATVESSLDTDWQAAATSRGWVVIAPVAPDGRSFARGAEALLVPLLGAIEHDFAIESGRVHLTGIANGGCAAFRLAEQQPSRFASLAVCSGYALAGSDYEHLDALVELPIAMFAVGHDEEPLNEIERTHARLLELGARDAQLTIPMAASDPVFHDGARLVQALESFRAPARERAQAESAVRAVLDDFHLAASQADGPRYFAHFTADATYIGTDATERWSLAEFRAYATPYFSAGKGWTYTPIERHVGLSFDRQTAWFDERLNNAKYGEVRGSGVLRKQGQTWRIAQYVLSFAVPNELSSELVERIRKTPRGR